VKIAESNSRTSRRTMRLALALAKKGNGKVFPNPMVGCVIVDGDAIVGRGYHKYFGGPHAEICALTQAGKKANGSTMYVTLEPCNHVGKTPPCTDAIIRSGVKRVVVASLDPDAKVRGKGIKKLRDSSVEVTAGLMKREATKLNAHYMKSRRDTKALVIVKAAMSADGKIATRIGDSKWISSRRSRAFVHKLRSTVDAIVVGHNTTVRDNPRLTSHGAGRNPVRVILDANLRVPLRSNIFDGKAPTIVLHTASSSKEKLKRLQKKRIITVRMPHRSGTIGFRDIIAKLKQFSLERILIEGGGETIASAFESGVVTDLVLFIAPKIIGGRTAITPVEGLGIADVRNSLKLHDLTIAKIGPDIMLTAKVHSN
jgi:diaminohydroxyphosphoribosylaminopyrimidine deaminase / 5-amino-6-(5-phosphoribosylamino)uracil reductase